MRRKRRIISNLEFHYNSDEKKQGEIIYNNINGNQQILKAYDFAHDELFEQLMQVEQGANANELQQTLQHKNA